MPPIMEAKLPTAFTMLTSWEEPPFSNVRRGIKVEVRPVEILKGTNA
ncbi:hypothetical protein [Pyrococcus furiosus]|nr:hypothetical protein [Pyrococcus furiosus]